MSTCRRMQYLSPCTKLKYKWIKDLSINQASLNLIEKKVENSLEFKAIGGYFINTEPVAQTLRATINKWDLLKLRSFYKART